MKTMRVQMVEGSSPRIVPKSGVGLWKPGEIHEIDEKLAKELCKTWRFESAELGVGRTPTKTKSKTKGG